MTLLARGERYQWIKTNGLVLVNELTGTTETSRVSVTETLDPDAAYDLVVVLIRKNKLGPVIETLAGYDDIKNILFMGNNASGFDEYVEHLPKENILFGFPGAGGGIKENVVHYVDREKVNQDRKGIMLGEIDGEVTERTREIKALFETSGIPVELTTDIDGWLKYHVAMVSPLANGLYKHQCDNRALAKDTATVRTMIRAAKEGGRVLKAAGYAKRHPFQFNLFYWLPEILNVKALESLLVSRFADIGFSLHAAAARDEVEELAAEFQTLIDKTSIETPNINALEKYVHAN